MVHCPNCRTINLTPTALKGITCLRCPSCRGALFTDTSLRMQADGKLLDAIEEGADTKSIVSPLECQECHHKMQRLIFPVTATHCAVLDKCGECARFWIQKSDVTDHVHDKPLEPTVELKALIAANQTGRRLLYGHPYYSWQNSELSLWCDLLFLILY